MFEIVFFYLKQSIRSYLVSMLLLGMLFILCGISFENILEGQAERGYTDFLEEELWVYPQEVYGTGQDEPEGTGSAWLEIVEMDGGGSYACVFMEQLLAGHLLMGLEGRNLSYTSGENEVVLYGQALGSRYAVGESIKIGGSWFQVVGKYPAYMPLWEMFLYSADIDLENSYTHSRNGNMLFVNNRNAFAGGDVSVQSCVFSSRRMTQWEGGISMGNAKEELLAQIRDKQMFEGSSVVLLFCLAGYVCMMLSMVQYKKARSLYGILILCGMGRVRYFSFLAANTFFTVCCAAFLYLLFASVFLGQDYYDERFWCGQWYILGGMGAYMACILLAFHIRGYRASVLQLVKEG